MPARQTRLTEPTRREARRAGLAGRAGKPVALIAAELPVIGAATLVGFSSVVHARRSGLFAARTPRAIGAALFVFTRIAAPAPVARRAFALTFTHRRAPVPGRVAGAARRSAFLAGSDVFLRSG